MADGHATDERPVRIFEYRADVARLALQGVEGAVVPRDEDGVVQYGGITIDRDRVHIVIVAVRRKGPALNHGVRFEGEELIAVSDQQEIVVQDG